MRREQRAYLDIECRGEIEKCVHQELLPTALDIRDRCPREANQFAQAALRQPTCISGLADTLPNILIKRLLVHFPPDSYAVG